MLDLVLSVALAASQSVAESAAARANPQGGSRERLICRSRPLLGSRVQSRRVCKTAEEWRIYENDLEASRRDINDRGARGCDMQRSPEC